METNEEKAQQNESSYDSSGSGGDCCSSGSGSLKSLKTAAFVLVILAAGALAAHSVLSNGTNSPCAAGVCPLNKACSSSETCGATEANPGNVTCPSEKKANNPSSCCPKTGAPSGCPKAATPGSCPNTETPSSCPKTATVPGCCPNAGSE